MPNTSHQPRRGRRKGTRGGKTGRGGPSKMVVHRIRDTTALRSSVRVYEAEVKLRRSIDSSFGKEAGLGVHGLKGRTRRKVPGLRPQVAHMVHLLKDEARELPPLQDGGLAVDRGAWLRQIEPPFLKLEELYCELFEVEFERDAARDRRSAAMQAFDAEYGKVLRYVEGVFGLLDCGQRAIRHLRPLDQRRRMSRRAKAKRAVPAAARRRRSRQAVRTAVSSLAGWLGRWRGD